MEEITGQGYQDPTFPAGAYEVNLNQPFLKNLAGWATFRAIMDIIIGVFSCFGFILIVPAVYGVFQVISGLKLLNAVDDLKKFMASNDTKKVSDTFYNMFKYFKFNGISLIIQICMVIVVTILYIFIIAYVMKNMPNMQDFFNNINSNQYGS